jgi:hypothetical protein
MAEAASAHGGVMEKARQFIDFCERQGAELAGVDLMLTEALQRVGKNRAMINPASLVRRVRELLLIVSAQARGMGRGGRATAAELDAESAAHDGAGSLDGKSEPLA